MSGIKIFAPATVSNVACGFDTLGFALHRPGDEIVARLSATPGVQITKITGDGGKLPLETAKNTAGVAALEVLRHVGRTDVGIELQIHKKMPIGSGLGSSAASAVAGAMAANHLLGKPFTKRELLPFASKGEQIASGAVIHLDNVAPCMMGGIILIRHNASFDVHRIYGPEGLYATLVYPEIEILTKAARAMLSDTVPLRAAIQQAANLGGLIVGLQRGDLDLISRSMHDHLIEHQRAALIPSFKEVKQAALDAGALGCSISGAGPAIFALNANSLIAEQVGEAMSTVFNRLGIKNQVFCSAINNTGANLC